MSARPLYLQPSGDAYVKLDNAVALRIEVDARLAQRAPLSQISRVVSRTSVRWDSDALVACMKRGIPIHFIDAAGKAQGFCFGARRVETTLAVLLKNALDSAEWSHHYNEWKGNQHRARAAQALLLCQLSASDHNLKNVHNVLCNLHRIRHGEPAGAALSALQRLAHAEASAVLDATVGDAQLINWYRPGLCLIDDFSALIGLHAHTVVHHAGALPPPEQMTRWSVLQYELHAALWASSAGALCGAFERFLREHWL